MKCADEENAYELRLAKEVDELRARLGIGLDDLTASELSSIVHAVDRVCSPFAEVNAELVERPVQVCDGVWFWRPTAGAQMWLEEYAEKWWPRGSVMYRWAQVYALKNARDPDAFARLTTKWEADKAIVACALRLPVSGAELSHAIARAYGASPPDIPRKRKTRADRIREQAKTDFASLIARLEVESGVPRNVWLWERSLVYVVKAYVELHEFAAAYSIGGGGSSARMLDELDEAIKDLAAVKMAIAVRVEAERKAAQEAERAETGTERPSGAPEGDR